MPKRRPDLRQLALFSEPAEVYPARKSVELEGAAFDVRIRSAMARALTECALSREQVTERMGAILGRPVSENMLDAYTAESRPDHQVSLVRFWAFTRATGATWLWDELVRDDGLLVVSSEEGRLAELGLIDQQMRQLQERKTEIRKCGPVQITRRASNG
jgi:hypothetical protein